MYGFMFVVILVVVKIFINHVESGWNIIFYGYMYSQFQSYHWRINMFLKLFTLHFISCTKCVIFYLQISLQIMSLSDTVRGKFVGICFCTNLLFGLPILNLLFTTNNFQSNSCDKWQRIKLSVVWIARKLLNVITEDIKFLDFLINIYFNNNDLVILTLLKTTLILFV